MSHPQECPKCGSIEVKQIPGKPPHWAGLRCAVCDRFLRWLPKPVGSNVLQFPQDGGDAA